MENQKITRKRKKKINSQFLSPDEIKDSLWAHGWLNNTLSPVSTKRFWDITKNIVPRDEIPYSAMFAQSYANSFVHKTIVFLATDKRVFAIIDIAGVISAKDYSYNDFAAIDLYSDKYMKSLIYVDIYLSKFRFYKLETSDPSSSLHFKKTVFDIQKAPKSHVRFKPIMGTASVTKRFVVYLWRKLAYMHFWTDYHKNVGKIVEPENDLPTDKTKK